MAAPDLILAFAPMNVQITHPEIGLPQLTAHLRTAGVPVPLHVLPLLSREDASLVNASALPDGEFLQIVRWARTSFYEDRARLERLAAFHGSLGMQEHPLFRRGHWRQVLGHPLP